MSRKEKKTNKKTTVHLLNSGLPLFKMNCFDIDAIKLAKTLSACLSTVTSRLVKINPQFTLFSPFTDAQLSLNPQPSPGQTQHHRTVSFILHFFFQWPFVGLVCCFHSHSGLEGQGRSTWPPCPRCLPSVI